MGRLLSGSASKWARDMRVEHNNRTESGPQGATHRRGGPRRGPTFGQGGGAQETHTKHTRTNPTHRSPLYCYPTWAIPDSIFIAIPWIQ